MKRKTAILCMMICCLMLVTAMCGCKRQPGPEPEPSGDVEPPVTQEPTATEPPSEPESEEPAPSGAIEYRSDTREKKVEEEGSILLETHFSVPVVDELTSVTAYYQDWLSNQEYYASLEADYARERFKEAQRDNGVFIPFTIESDYTVMRNDGVLFSVLRDLYENTGGVRPAYRLIAENFVVADGALLVADDVFTVPGEEYKSRIRDAVMNLLPEKIAASGEDFYYDDVEEMMMEVWDTRDFCLTDTHLIVFWESAGIAPAIAGVQQFELPLEALADILDPKWMP